MVLVEKLSEGSMDQSRISHILVTNTCSCVCRQVQDITSILMEQFVPQGKNVISQEQRTYAKILHAQVSCKLSHNCCITLNQQLCSAL